MYHENANYDKQAAIEAINTVKNDGLLVILPTYSKKEKQLKNLAIRDASQKEVANNKLLQLYAEREMRKEAILGAFTEKYSFSKTYFIPDSLVANFESGAEGVYFINTKGELDPYIHYSGSYAVKLIQPFDREWRIMIGNKVAPNPFPNNFKFFNNMCRTSSIGQPNLEGIYNCTAFMIAKRFDEFHSKAK